MADNLSLMDDLIEAFVLEVREHALLPHVVILPSEVLIAFQHDVG